MLSIFIIIYFESTIYKIINVVGINLNSFSNLVQIIINIVIKILLCFLIYLIYKKNFKKRYSNFNLIRGSLFFLIYLVILVISMYVFKYIISFIGDIFNISIIEEEF